MATGDVETVHEDGRWKNKVEGGQRARSVHTTKATAVAMGRAMAQERRVEHVIKNLDGTISEKRSYRNDPRDIAD